MFEQTVTPESMTHALPLVSIVVVTLNRFDLLKKCLKRLCEQDYEAIEILVVDNGSDRNAREALATDFPAVRVIRLDRNTGFAGGNNRGIEAAKGKYVALINNDALAGPRWISAMVETAEADSSIAAVASIIADGNRTGVLDSCGVGIGLDGMSRQALRGAPVPRLKHPGDVFLFSGCACLLRTAVLKTVGLFDEDFFAYCEDTDMGLRMRRAGWKIVVAPGADVAHLYSMTGGKFSLQKVYWVERNHLWVAIKNFPWPLLAAIPAVTLLRYLAQAYSLLRGGGELNEFTKQSTLSEIAATYTKAYMEMFKKLPAMIKKRRAFRKMHRLGDTEMLRLIWKYHLSIREIVGMPN
ncbi:MAG: glycosyltransferase family 2 protein [Pseudomonadota bacterium]